MNSLRACKSQLNVVVTGASRGLGKSIVRDFAKKGDRVIMISRKQQDLDDLKDVCGCGSGDSKKMIGYAVDIGDIGRVRDCFDTIRNDGYDIDILVNCAAISGGYNRFEALNLGVIDQIVRTNLLGTAACCSEAFDIMREQETGGVIFNFAGNGSNGWASPNYSVYGSTKAGIRQLTMSLQKEWKDTAVDVHMISPGLMITDLLMENLDEKTFEIIRKFCSTPELVAHHLVPKMRNIYYSAKKDKDVKFQTVLKMITKAVMNYNKS